MDCGHAWFTTLRVVLKAKHKDVMNEKQQAWSLNRPGNVGLQASN